MPGNNPFDYFDAIYCINLDSATERWQGMGHRFEALGISERVRRFPAVETPQSHHIGCALSHRSIVDQANQRGFGNVLVLEDDAIFLEDTPERLPAIIAELAVQDWNLFHLGGHTWGEAFANAPGCAHLRSPCRGLTSAHAVAYNRLVYATILDQVPGRFDAMVEWLALHAGIDQYLRSIDKRFLSRPSICSQAPLLPVEAPDLRDRYTLGDAFRRNPDWEGNRSASGIVLSNRRTGEDLLLNRTAALVLELVAAKGTAAAVRGALQTVYPEAVAIRRDVEQTLADLVRLGVLDRSRGG